MAFRELRWAFVLAGLWFLAGCKPVPAERAGFPAGGAGAGPAGMDLEAARADPEPLSLEAAREAHRRSEVRRHLQFLEAVRPGYLLSATAERVAQARIDGGQVGLGELYEVGRLIFEHEYTFADGLGNGSSRESPSRSPFRRVHAGRFGGPDTNTCGSCHWRGGPAGAGGLPDASFILGDGDRTGSADARNPPSLQGAVVVQALAREMSAELQAARAGLIEEARRSGRPVERELSAKGIRFGVLRAAADGSLDTSRLLGVDGDLVIKPFGWKGTFAGLREFVAESLQIHFGIQCEDLLAAHRSRPDPELLGSGTDPEDPDGDGVKREMTSGQLTALVTFLALQELPVVRPPEEARGLKPAAPGLPPPATKSFLAEWARGRRLFEEIGCASCHVPFLVLKDPLFATRSEVSGKTLEIDLARHGDRPRLEYDPERKGYPVWLFSDLKRHDLGEENQALHVQEGVGVREYLTRRLWGLSASGPYMYDGRAPWIDHAVEAHRGEAATASVSFSSLPEGDKAALRIYLLSLSRQRRLVVP
jgi:mono/diheme cytochrome c family protein